MKPHKKILRGYSQRLYIFLSLLCSLHNVSSEVKLGGMESWGFNGVRSGMVSLMSPNKLKIRQFDYTGEGPALYFMVGDEDDPYNEEFAELTGLIIPDENGSCDKLQPYKNENIVLTMPKGMKFTDYDYLAVYCVRFNHNFGFVQIKRDANTTEMEPMDPTEKLPKRCSQDHLEDEEDADEEDEEDERRRKRRKSISGFRKWKKSLKNYNIANAH